MSTIFGISSANTAANKEKKQQRANTYTVTAGENVTKIAKKFNLSPTEFKEWTGLKDDNIKIGQKIHLPTTKIPDGQGLGTLAKSYGLTLKELCNLNNIKDTYKPKKGESFYIYKKVTKETKTNSTPISQTQKPTVEKPKPKIENLLSSSKSQNIKMIPNGGLTGDSKAPNIATKPPLKPLDENNEVTAEIINFPAQNKGDLFGKTIMVNAGHGWGKEYFDPGAAPKEAKEQEWLYNRQIAEEVIKELTSRGANVVYTTGKSNLVRKARDEIKHDLLISLHCDSASKNANGVRIFHNDKNAKNKEFADTVCKNLKGNYHEKVSVKNEKETKRGKIGILEDKNSILCEMGFITNEKDREIFESTEKRKAAAKALADACVNVYKTTN